MDNLQTLNAEASAATAKFNAVHHGPPGISVDVILFLANWYRESGPAVVRRASPRRVALCQCVCDSEVRFSPSDQLLAENSPDFNAMLIRLWSTKKRGALSEEGLPLW